MPMPTGLKQAMIQRIAKDLHNRRLAAYATACASGQKTDTPNVRFCSPWDDLDDKDRALYTSAVEQVCDVLETKRYSLFMPTIQLHAPTVQTRRYLAPLFGKAMYLTVIETSDMLDGQGHDEIQRLTDIVLAEPEPVYGFGLYRLGSYIPRSSIVKWILSDMIALGVQVVSADQESDDEAIESCAIRLLSPCLNDYTVRIWEKIKDEVIDDVCQCVDVEREGFTDGDVALAIGRAVASAVGIEI